VSTTEIGVARKPSYATRSSTSRGTNLREQTQWREPHATVRALYIYIYTNDDDQICRSHRVNNRNDNNKVFSPTSLPTGNERHARRAIGGEKNARAHQPETERDDVTSSLRVIPSWFSGMASRVRTRLCFHSRRARRSSGLQQELSRYSFCHPVGRNRPMDVD